ncbi:MAG: hypothetical protein HKN41_08700 [Ilumatobacter sp.]|nr:hypothetical protein [Ilumatobacter sp.]
MQLSNLEPLLPRASSGQSQRAIVRRLKDTLAAADAQTSRDIIEVLAHVGQVEHEPSPAEQSPVTTSTLSVAEVADRLRQRSPSTDPLEELIARATAPERRLLRSLRHSEVERSRESALIAAIAAASGWAPADVRTAATVLGSVSAAAEFVFTDSRDAGFDLAVDPGRPVMLMGTSPAPDIDEVVASGVPVVVEQLLPGTRIQAHRRNGRVWLFDAHGVDVTSDYPLVTSVLSGVARADLVLDGIVIRPTSSGVAPVHARFFDLLFDAESLIDRPLEERRSRLESLLPAEHRVTSIVTAETADIESMLRLAVQHGDEGVVLKELAAPYDGSPASPAWRLLRPVFTFSLVAVGAELGSVDSGEFSTVHVAARSDRSFVTVGHVSRGLTRTMLAWQSARFRELAVDSGDGESSPEVTLRPELVLDVRCNGVQLDDALPGGVRLDAPRVIRYRPDLDPAQATGVHELRDLVSDAARGQGSDHPSGPPLLPPVGAPRLPPPAAPGPFPDPAEPRPLASPPTAELTSSDASTGDAPTGTTIANIEYEPYQAPELLPSRWPKRVVLAARATALVWVMAVTIAAGLESATALDVLSLAGFAVLITIVGSGWWWTDHLTRNLKLLDGRLPTRVRSVSGWLVPLVVVVVLELTVARMEPTDLFDIRPLLIGSLTALAFWRPYALVRRILATLIRVRQDALLGSAYVIDLVAFGLVWWRLSSGDGGSPEGVSYGELVAVSASAALALALGMVVWVMLTRACDRAIDHRASSQRTRYDHRMLRLAGVDPTDPDVWWELVARRAREDRAAELAIAEATGAQQSTTQLGAADVDALVDDVRRTHATELRRLGEERSQDLMVRLRERLASVVGDDRDDGVDPAIAVAPAAPSEQPAPEAEPDRKAVRDREPPLVEQELAPDGRIEDAPIDEHSEDVDSDELDDEHTGELVPVPSEQAPLGTPDQADEAGDDQTTVEDLGAPTQPVAEEPAMADVTFAIDPDLPLARLLREAKAAQVEAALAEQRRSIDDKHADGERMVPPTLYALDAVRLLIVIVFACVTVAAGRFMTLVLGAGTEFQSITASSVGELETARQTIIIAFLGATAIVPFWALLFSIYGRRAGGPGPSLSSALAPAVVGLGATSAGLVAHSSDSTGLLLVTACVSVIAAIVAAARIEPIRHWFDLRAHTLIAWVCIVPALLLTIALGGLLAEIDPKDSLPLLAFVGVMLTLGSALMTVFAALSSSDLQDEIRVTPSMAVTAASRRRR